jgi:hypothetical protein
MSASGRSSRGRLIGIPGTIESIEIWFFVEDPFLGRLPGRFDGFDGFDVKRWWWAWELDDAFPKAVEAKGEFDLLRAFDGANEFHGSFTAWALEWIGSPDFEDEVAPEGRMDFADYFGGKGTRRISDWGILDF